jgi:hypothetical protein
MAWLQNVEFALKGGAATLAFALFRVVPKNKKASRPGRDAFEFDSWLIR